MSSLQFLLSMVCEQGEHSTSLRSGQWKLGGVLEQLHVESKSEPSQHLNSTDPTHTTLHLQT